MSKSTKTTKYYDLFSVLKAGKDKGVSPDTLCKTLKFSSGMLAVYIHALRNKFGAVIESVRNGRTVTAYRLMNVAECEKTISPNRKPRTVKTKKGASKLVADMADLKFGKKSTATKMTKVVKTKVARKSKKDGPVEVIDDMSVTEITESDLEDIKNQLGIA